MTFEEWYPQNPPTRFWNTGEFEYYLKQVWKAAQEQLLKEMYPLRDFSVTTKDNTNASN